MNSFSPSSVIAFLMASPWANLPLTIILIGFFGLNRALFIILAAIIIALITGYIYQVLESKKWVEGNHNSEDLDESFSIREDLRTRIKGYYFSLNQFYISARN